MTATPVLPTRGRYPAEQGAAIRRLRWARLSLSEAAGRLGMSREDYFALEMGWATLKPGEWKEAAARLLR